MLVADACIRRGGCVRRPQHTRETPCTERAYDTASDVDVAWVCATRTCHGTRPCPRSAVTQSGGAGAAGHHAGKDRAVLVIVKPRRWRSDRAFRTALGLTTPARGA